MKLGMLGLGFMGRTHLQALKNIPQAEVVAVASDVPEWGGVEVSMGLEEQAVATPVGGRFVDGYPRSLYLIR